jgi:WD40 repeat protein
MAEQSPRYVAFISYSHSHDLMLAKTLQKRLERYVLPRAIATLNGQSKRRRMGKIFRDEDELVPGGNLPERIVRAIESSETMVVLCSPAAANSRYVNMEVATFVQMRGTNQIIAVVTGGEPDAVRRGLDASQECLPEALRWWTHLPETGAAQEPLWVDWRCKPVDQISFLRLVAALLQVDSFDDLIRRDIRARYRRALIIAAAAATLVVVVVTVATAALLNQRDNARRKSEAMGEAAYRAVAISDYEQAARLALIGVNAAKSTWLPYRPINAEAALRSAILGNRRRGQLLAGGESAHAVAVSGDGRLAAVGGTNGVQVWDLGAGKPLGPRLAEGKEVTKVAISPDGQLLVIGVSAPPDGESGTLSFWRTKDFRPARVDLDSGGAIVRDLAFSPDGTAFAASPGFYDGGGLVQIWDVRTMLSKPARPPEASLGLDGGRVTARFSHDAKSLVTASKDGVTVWDVKTHRQLGAALLPGGQAICADFTPDGHHIITGTSRGRLQEWDVKTHAEVGDAMTTDGSIDTISIVANGRAVAASSGGTTTFWTIPRHNQLDITLYPAPLAVAASAVPVVVSIEPEGLRVWAADVATMVPSWELPDHYRSALLSSDRRHLFAGNFSLAYWNVERMDQPPTTVDLGGDDAYSISLAPDGKTVAASAYNGIYLMSVPSMKVLRTRPGRIGERVTAFSPDGRFLAASATDRSAVEILDSNTLLPVGEVIKLRSSYVTDIDWARDGASLLVSTRSELTVWDFSTRKMLAARQETDPTSARLEPGRRRVWFESGWHVQIWDYGSDQMTTAPVNLPGFTSFDYSALLRFSPDGTVLAIGAGGQVVLLDTETGLELGRKDIDRTMLDVSTNLNLDFVTDDRTRVRGP